MIDDDTRSSIEMIRESAQGIASRGDLTRIRKLRYSTPGFDRTVWAQICELGWTALRVSEDKGGVGLGLLPYCALAEELGRGLVPEPLISATLATSLLEGEALDQQLSGERLVLPAWQDSRNALAPKGGFVIVDNHLTGIKKFVPMASGADEFLVIGEDQVALVATKGAGVQIESATLQDGTTMATVRFDKAPCLWTRRINPNVAFAEAQLATASYLLGVMKSALDMTVTYLKDREQFGQKIGKFQVLQHMAVDIALEVEVSSASIEQAALQWDREGPTDRAYAAISRAKARASRSALKVTRDAVQLHGGIGFTDEHDVGLCLRKAMIEAARFGGPEQHLARFAHLRPVKEEA